MVGEKAGNKVGDSNTMMNERELPLAPGFALVLHVVERLPWRRVQSFS